MKELFDIQVVLATPADFEHWEDRAEEACERLNELLHMVYHRLDDDTSTQSIERIVQSVWENWLHDPHLADLDEDDTVEWVDQLLSSWDDDQPLT